MQDAHRRPSEWLDPGASMQESARCLNPITMPTWFGITQGSHRNPGECPGAGALTQGRPQCFNPGTVIKAQRHCAAGG